MEETDRDRQRHMDTVKWRDTGDREMETKTGRRRQADTQISGRERGREKRGERR